MHKKSTVVYFLCLCGHTHTHTYAHTARVTHLRSLAPSFTWTIFREDFLLFPAAPLLMDLLPP